MKRILLIITIFLVSFSLVGCNKKDNKKEEKNIIKIIQYKVGTEEIIREINVENAEAINKLNEYLAKIEPLSPEEAVKLELAREISVIYNDNVSVDIRKGEEGYCYYTNKEKSISSLSKIPEGMYEMVINIVKNGK